MKKQHRYALIAICAVVILLLVAAQIWLEREYELAVGNVERANVTLDMVKAKADARRMLLERYKDFDAMISAGSHKLPVYPSTALELFTEVDEAMKRYHVEHTNRSSSGGSNKGSTIQLQISFSGSYYGVLNALAALRDSSYMMKISDLMIKADDGGKVSGTMTIISSTGKN